MNWDTTPAQDTILDFFRESVVPVKDEKGNIMFTLEQAARYLDISEKKLADISGSGKRGGQIPKTKVGGRPFYRRRELGGYLIMPCGHPRSAVRGNGNTHWCYLCQKGAK